MVSLRATTWYLRYWIIKSTIWNRRFKYCTCEIGVVPAYTCIFFTKISLLWMKSMESLCMLTNLWSESWIFWIKFVIWNRPIKYQHFSFKSKGRYLNTIRLQQRVILYSLYFICVFIFVASCNIQVKTMTIKVISFWGGYHTNPGILA